jgi:uncharacterized protein
MNKSFFSLVVAITFTVSAMIPAYAECNCQTKEDPRTISVNGSANLRVSPDKATVKFTIYNIDKSPEKARLNNTDTAKKVLNAVRALDIPEKKIHLENLSINEEFQYNPKNGSNESKGYRANRSFTVEIEKLDIGSKALAEKIADVVATVVSNGSNQLESVQYGLVNQDEYNSQVLNTAIKNAKLKAEGLLKSIGAELGKVRTVNESYNQPYIRRDFAMAKAMAYSADGAAMESSPDSFSEGDLEINGNVSVVFEIL